MTKREQNIYNAYLRSNLTTLKQCYNSWSWAKERAYNECKNRCAEMKGHDFRIISYNLNVFTIGYLYEKDNKTYLHYETNVNVLDFEVE